MNKCDYCGRGYNNNRFDCVSCGAPVKVDKNAWISAAYSAAALQGVYPTNRKWVDYRQQMRRIPVYGGMDPNPGIIGSFLNGYLLTNQKINSQF